MGVYQVAFEHAQTGTLRNNTVQLNSQTLDFKSLTNVSALSLEESLQLELLFGFNPFQPRPRFRCTAPELLEAHHKRYPSV